MLHPLIACVSSSSLVSILSVIKSCRYTLLIFLSFLFFFCESLLIFLLPYIPIARLGFLFVPNSGLF
jgi:hypothetical protein